MVYKLNSSLENEEKNILDEKISAAIKEISEIENKRIEDEKIMAQAEILAQEMISKQKTT
jgi:hypothetical protein